MCIVDLDGNKHVKMIQFQSKVMKLELLIMAHSHCTGTGTGQGQGPGTMGLYIILCTAHTTQVQVQGQGMMSSKPISPPALVLGNRYHTLYHSLCCNVNSTPCSRSLCRSHFRSRSRAVCMIH